MDLDWAKQIQVMNKYVMDWRWKAFASKIDPAQLKTSVTDYLCPKLEVGLAHANITQQICNSWTSTITFTICHRGGMSTIGTLNKMGFCLLADIPDLWLRAQTSRATELLVNLNTKICLSGRSTRARLCNLFSLSASEITSTLQKLASQALKKREYNRLVPTIQYLKSLSINIIAKSAGDEKPLKLVSDIERLLKYEKPQAIFVYTDGSTTPRGKHSNSGLGIVITDQSDKTLFSGGMVVRADGNNFIPEVAAAAIAIKACPRGLPMNLKMDSKAAIGAITKGLVSERRRVRAPGRAWLNFCRLDYQMKKQHLKVEHVSSHKGTLTTEQQRNELGDTIATNIAVRVKASLLTHILQSLRNNMFFNTGKHASKATRVHI